MTIPAIIVLSVIVAFIIYQMITGYSRIRELTLRIGALNEHRRIWRRLKAECDALQFGSREHTTLHRVLLTLDADAATGQEVAS